MIRNNHTLSISLDYKLHILFVCFTEWVQPILKLVQMHFKMANYKVHCQSAMIIVIDKCTYKEYCIRMFQSN